MMNNKNKLAGYRLHKERLLFSGGEVTRTIKYPLVPLIPTEEALQSINKFEDAVIADDLRVRGDLNLNDYLTYTVGGKTPYSLFDFWVDCLGAGVIWMSKPSELIDFLSSKYKLTSPVDIIWGKASPRITKFFEKNKFKDILQSDPLRSSSTKKSFYKRMVGYLKEEYLTKRGEIYEVTSPEASKEIDFIVNSFFDSNDVLVLDGVKQYEFWKKEYGLDKAIIEASKPQGRYTDITFIVIPELIGKTDSRLNLEDLINKREEWLGSQDQLLSILGLSNNFNGLSNFLGRVVVGLQKDYKELIELYDAQKVILPILEEHREKVLESLNFLSEKAKLLGKTSLSSINGWHEYRSVFGGKLQSWFTNSQKRKLELDGQIAKFKESLSKAQKYLQNQQFSGDAKKEQEDILDLLSLLERFFADDSKSIKAEENYQVFDVLLSLVKRRLNFFYQAYIQKEGDETKVKKFDAFKGLYEKIDKPVAFYGESTRRSNEKFVNKTLPILEDGIENIERLLSYLKESFNVLGTFENVKSNQEASEDHYRNFLQFFWNKYSEGTINSSVFKKKYEEILKENTDEIEWKKLQDKSQKGRYAFYKSPYAKGTFEEIKIKGDDYLGSIQGSVLLFTDFLSSFNTVTLLKDVNLLLDWIELSKNIVSLLLRFNTKEFYELDGLGLDNFPQAKRYVELFGNRQYFKNEFSFILQSLIFSEIRGAATLYSRKEYTARYSVQVVGSDNKFKLYYIPSDSSINISEEIITSPPYSAERKQLMKPHSYVLALGDMSAKNRENLSSIALGKKEIKLTFWSDEEIGKLFRISSSPYQLQFLDKYLYRPKGWENIDIALNEWSFVVERRYKVEWDLDTKKPKFLPVTSEKEKKKNKLYVAIPFNLKPNNETQKLAPLKKIAEGNDKQKRDLSRLAYPILGIDVGEYGLAYYLAKFNFDPNTHKLLDVESVKDEKGNEICGFIEDRNIANIKDRFAEIQQRAKYGAFDEEDTTVARVRENAVGALRNRIHVVITHEDASVVYEDSISNFETGSGRTTKIYNSVKRADTEFESEADKQVHKHVWGEGAKLIGRNVSAYASSYTCVKCLRSLYEIKKSDLSSIKVVKREGRIRIVSLTSPYGEIKGYISGKEKYQEGYQFKDTDEDLKAFRKIVRDFTRPPVSKNSEVLTEYAKEILLGDKIDEFRKRRGNSSIYVCPFCQFVADADIQAAFMMAVRGYLRFSGVVPSSDDSIRVNDKEERIAGESFLEQTINYLKEIDRNKIINLLSLKF